MTNRAARRIIHHEMNYARATLGLIIGAVLVGGVLAGVGILRLLVEMPAWRQLGPAAWADFSRHADLGNGLVLFPAVGLGATLLAVAAAIGHRLGGSVPRAAALPLHLGAALALAGMVATAFAAPRMLSLRSIGDDPPAIARAFAAFALWGGIRGVVQTLAFAANVWALVAVAAAGRNDKAAG